MLSNVECLLRPTVPTNTAGCICPRQNLLFNNATPSSGDYWSVYRGISHECDFLCSLAENISYN